MQLLDSDKPALYFPSSQLREGLLVKASFPHHEYLDRSQNDILDADLSPVVEYYFDNASKVALVDMLLLFVLAEDWVHLPVRPFVAVAEAEDLLVVVKHELGKLGTSDDVLTVSLLF